MWGRECIISLQRTVDSIEILFTLLCNRFSIGSDANKTTCFNFHQSACFYFKWEVILLYTKSLRYITMNSSKLIQYSKNYKFKITLYKNFKII